MNISCILIPVLVGLICGILGYLIGKMGAKPDNSALLSLEAELDNLRAQLNACRADLKICQMNLSSAKAVPVVTLLPFDAVLASNVFGRRIIQDDLKVVEGIGPKIEELYHDAGIKSWLALSQTSKERSLQILHCRRRKFFHARPNHMGKTG